MTDPELVAKKLAFIETCVRELQTLARPERIEDDLREERFVEHTLQLAIQRPPAAMNASIRSSRTTRGTVNPVRSPSRRRATSVWNPLSLVREIRLSPKRW
jgi:hypothetical protein